MWGRSWLTGSLVMMAWGMLCLGATPAWAEEGEAPEAQLTQEEPESDEYERPPRPEKPPIQLVESGPFKMKDKRGYRNLIVVGPRLIPPGIGGRYIHSVTDYISVMVGGGYAGWELFGNTLRHADARVGIDYQPIGNGLHGFYIGPRAVYRSFLGSFSFGGDTSGLRTQTMSVGGVVGWRAIWDPGLSLGAGIGGSYTSWLASAGDTEEVDVELTGTAPMLEITLGFAF